MAKRRRASGVSLDGLMAELKSLDVRRQEILSNIQGAVASVTGGWTSSSAQRRGRRAGAKTAKARKPRGMSAAQRKAVSARMKKYWAARRKAAV
jgi:hypothetical protein